MANEPWIDCLILAEFDIDKGSSIRLQYPRPTGEDEQTLAEMMLPDGVHNRKDDWTVFFLNRNEEKAKANAVAAKEHQKQYLKEAKIRQAQQAEQAAAQPISEEKPQPKEPPFEAFLYEYDESTAQNWVLKGKRWIFLLPTLIEIKETDSVDDENVIYQVKKHGDLDYTQLEPLFSCVLTETGLALGFRFADEAQEKQFSSQVAYLIETDIAAIELELQLLRQPPPPPSEDTSTEEPEVPDMEVLPFLYCLNRVTNQHDKSVRRGAVVKALSLCSRHPFVHVFKPLLILALDSLFKEGNPEKVLKELFEIINNIKRPEEQQSKPSTYHKMLLRKSEKKKIDLDIVVKYNSASLKVKIPTLVSADEVGEGNVIPLIQKFGQATLAIWNAVLCEKRIVFVGKLCNAEELCSYVLGCLALVCPPLRGIAKRSFPYVNLGSLTSFLNVPGYIVATANPLFEERKEWWDLLCNVDTGRVTFEGEETKHTYPKLDNEFWEKANFSLISKYGEETMRTLFSNYTQHLIDIATEVEEFATEAEKKISIETYVKRIESWKKTQTFKTYDADVKKWNSICLIRNEQVPRYIRKLRVRKDISEQEMITIYHTFTENITSEEQLVEFLSYLPESKGGLYPVAVSLFHSSESVRKATVELFRRLDNIQSGVGFLKGLNFFLNLAYQRQLGLVK